eukprot:3602984-Pyramimonas_sp.AAC.1
MSSQNCLAHGCASLRAAPCSSTVGSSSQRTRPNQLAKSPADGGADFAPSPGTTAGAGHAAPRTWGRCRLLSARRRASYGPAL